MIFFFSSRRRHTRWTGDWSSDVCSSDLRAFFKVAERYDPRTNRWQQLPDMKKARGGIAAAAVNGRIVVFGSEERRVGKECSSRWYPDHLIKKMLYAIIMIEYTVV